MKGGLLRLKWRFFLGGGREIEETASKSKGKSGCDILECYAEKFAVGRSYLCGFFFNFLKKNFF